MVCRKTKIKLFTFIVRENRGNFSKFSWKVRKLCRKSSLNYSATQCWGLFQSWLTIISCWEWVFFWSFRKLMKNSEYLKSFKLPCKILFCFEFPLRFSEKINMKFNCSPAAWHNFQINSQKFSTVTKKRDNFLIWNFQTCSNARRQSEKNFRDMKNKNIHSAIWTHKSVA